MRELSFHIEKIAAAIDQEDKERNAAYKSASVSRSIKLPLVHRTANSDTLRSIFRDGYLRPPRVPSDRERGFNLEPSTYFSLGAGAYPNGNAALIFYPETVEHENAAYTPFDSGGLRKPYLEPSVHNPVWSDPKVREDFLTNHTGDCTEVSEFSLHYLRAHFREIQDYVSRPQESDPDWPPYHGLRHPDGPDRRAWTIEIRIPAQVSLKQLETVVLDGVDLTFREEFDEQLFAEDGPKVIVLEEGKKKVEGSRDLNPEERTNPDPVQRAVSKFILDKYFFRSIIDDDY